MHRALVHLLRRHPVVMAALLAALVALGYFSWQFIDGTRHAARSPEPDLQLWMSPRFVARSWDLPKATIEQLMQIDPEAGRSERPRTLAEVLQRTGLSLKELHRRVELADAEERARRGLPERDATQR